MEKPAITILALLFLAMFFIWLFIASAFRADIISIQRLQSKFSIVQSLQIALLLFIPLSMYFISQIIKTLIAVNEIFT